MKSLPLNILIFVCLAIVAPLHAAPLFQDAGLAIGQGITGCWTGPFLRVAQQSFAQDQTTLHMTWDEEALHGTFQCQEACLDPLLNRLHEFKKDNASVWNNDYVALLFQRNDVFYDVIVDANGRIESASAVGTDFWRGRVLRQDTGITAEIEVGNGVWTANIRIPWDAIGGKAELRELFRFQAARRNPSLQETSVLFPCLNGFHTYAYFGSLALVEEVPELHPALPAFLPGKNVISCDNATVSGWIEVPGKPRQLFDTNEFELKHAGHFQFCWQINGKETPYWISPIYELTASAIPLQFDLSTSATWKNAVRRNDQVVVPGTTLQDGKNIIEVAEGFPGTLKAGAFEFVPPASKFQLYSQHTLLWPNWQAQEWCVTRGGLQMLLFAPRGFPDTTVSDYTIKLNLPKGFTLECASGYYNTYPNIRFTPDGTITIDKAIPFRKSIPSHEFLAAFIRVPEEFEDDVTELSFASSSPCQHILEVPQSMKVRLLPKLDGVAPKELLVYIWGGWLHALTNKAYIDTVLKDFAAAGINLVVNLPNQVIPYSCSFCFEKWGWPISPYLQEHPDAVLIKKDGTPDSTHVCPKTIRTPEFAAWLKSQVPGWLEKSGNPTVVEWDYEFRIENGPFSCYCPKCIDHTEDSVRHQDMAFFIKLLRDALQEVNPNIRFAIYSGYQSERSKQVYGIDWSLLKDTIDIAECGYGRPLADIQATRDAIGDMPLVLGALVLPYTYDDRKYPSQYTTAWLLRRAADASYGILLFNYPSFDGQSMHAIAEASKIMSKYEPFFRYGKRLQETIPQWAQEDTQVIEYQGRKILILMNSGIKPRTYHTATIPPGECLVLEL